MQRIKVQGVITVEEEKTLVRRTITPRDQSCHLTVGSGSGFEKILVGVNLKKPLSELT